MKTNIFVPAVLLFLVACNHKTNSPDVSDIQVNVKLERFEKSFFSIDTNHIAAGLTSVHSQFPGFYTDFMQEILGVSGAPEDASTQSVTKMFLRSYSPLAVDLQNKFSNTSDIEQELKKGLQHVKYYFPSYQVPMPLTFIGPLDAPGIALSKNYQAIGLQQFGGKDFIAYQSAEVQQMFPAYIIRRFDRKYIAPNYLKNIATDLFPDKSQSKPLLEQMVEKGKQLWLLDKFMPDTPDSLKTGFTQSQLKWCEENEGMIWNYFITSENLEAVEPDVIQNYIGDAPFTQGMPQSSPGNIGPWVGWQIVKKFADKKNELSLAEVMRTPPRKIVEEAKYKPK